jgi:hypothetical protein
MAVLFSPLQVIIVMMFLPYSSQDARPSVTVLKTMLLCAILSYQGHILQKRNDQQKKDTGIVQRQVGMEYDTKFVKPNAHRNPVRDVGIQFPVPTPVWDGSKWTPVPEVVVSDHTYFSPRGFRTHPNKAYAEHYDAQQSVSVRPSATNTPSLGGFYYSNASAGPSVADLSSPIRNAQTHKRATSPSKPQWPYTGSGDGGSFGVYSSAHSPLRKTASNNILRGAASGDGRMREGSPLKRSSVPAGGLHQRLMNVRDEPSRRDSGRY